MQNISHFTQLIRFNADSNQFSGTVNWFEFASLINSVYLHLNVNNLKGTIDFGVFSSN